MELHLEQLEMSEIAMMGKGMVMTPNNLDARLYYMDPHIVVSDSVKDSCTVVFLRHKNVNLEKMERTLKRIGFKVRPKLFTDEEKNVYYKLEAI
jgi:hypothetical protein